VRPPRRLAWIVAVAAIALSGAAPAARAEPTSRPGVVLVAVPGLLWSDVAVMPDLRELAARGAVGQLVVKSAGATTRCAAGLLTVSAGNRTSSPTTGCAIDPATWAQRRMANTRSQYDASLGLLGQTLEAHGIRRTAVTALAAPMLANAAGHITRVVQQLTTALKAGGVVSVVDDGLYAASTTARPAVRQAVDSQLATIVAEVPPTAVLIIAGISDGAVGSADLHPIVITGPGWPHRQLESPATDRAPFVETIDIAPTVLAIEGISPPGAVVGHPMRLDGSTVPSIATYVDQNRHARAQRTLGQRAFLIIGLLTILMMVLASIGRPRASLVGRWIARLLAPAPALVFLGNILPWWRWGQPSYAAIVVAAATVVAVVTARLTRRHETAALLVAPVLSLVILGVDQLTGSWLQQSAPLGDDPLSAGRFAGVGNLDFAVIASSALLVAGVVGARFGRRGAIAIAGGVCLVAVVIDGAPQLGDDIGGVLALVPAAIIAVALAARVRLTVARVACVVIATVVVAVGLALADYSRPPSSQTHVGRFVGQVLHGGAGTEFHRKFDSALASVGLTIGTFVVVFAIVLGLINRNRLVAAINTSTGVRAAAISVALVGILGAVLNDSGVTIAAMALIVGMGTIYGAGVSSPDPSDPARKPH
jgi:hypothetical protein